MSTSPAKLRLIFSILLAALTVLVAAVFIGEIADIYYSAEGSALPAYSPDTLREHLIAPFVFLFIWIAAIIAAYVVFELYPAPKARPSSKNNARALALLRGRIPSRGVSPQFDDAKRGMQSMRETRICVYSAAAAVCVAGAIYIFIYLITPSHYHPNDLHGDAMNLVRHVISWTAASLVACFAAAGVEAYAIRRELDFAKLAVKTGDKTTLPSPRVRRSLSKTERLVLLWTTRVAVAVVAICFIVLGAQNGGADGMLVKAINICTECIGLG